MSVDHSPLLNWNEVNKKFAEEKAASLIFKNLLKMSPVLDVLCYLLLISSGAIVALIFGNIDTIIQIFGILGVKIIFITLVGSVIFGFVSKYNSVMCQIGYLLSTETIDDFQKLFDNHQKEADEIEADALRRGIEIDAQIDNGRVLSSVYNAVPKWCFWIKRKISRSSNFSEALHGYVKNFIYQGMFLFFQVLMFGGFMISALTLLLFYS